jgi:hypothetical protein
VNKILIQEFGRNRHPPSFEVRFVFSDCRYDMILGRDIVCHLRLTLVFDKHNMVGPGCSTTYADPFSASPTSQRNELELNELDTHLSNLKNTTPDNFFMPAPISDTESAARYKNSFVSIPILPSQYAEANLSKITQTCVLLSRDQ